MFFLFSRNNFGLKYVVYRIVIGEGERIKTCLSSFELIACINCQDCIVSLFDLFWKPNMQFPNHNRRVIHEKNTLRIICVLKRIVRLSNNNLLKSKTNSPFIWPNFLVFIISLNIFVNITKKKRSNQKIWLWNFYFCWSKLVWNDFVEAPSQIQSPGGFSKQLLARSIHPNPVPSFFFF